MWHVAVRFAVLFWPAAGSMYSFHLQLFPDCYVSFLVLGGQINFFFL